MSLRERIQKLLHGSNKRKNLEAKRVIALEAQRKALSGERPPVLTRREKDVVQWLRRGYSNKQIAKELGISVTTVKWNMTNILGKFHTESSRQLLVLLNEFGEDESRYWVIE